MFKKVLIANRGEIAVRVIRACREMGIRTVAVFSKADADSLHVRYADEAFCIGPADSASSYRNIANILSAAEITDAEAIHPGYGFLAEDANFAEVCASVGIRFIGPTPENIRVMGDKAKAREAAHRAGVPVLPGSPGPLRDEKEALKLAQKIGFPVILKAAAGGGGRGMRVIHTEASLGNAFHQAQSEALASFGSGEIYIEKYVVDPRHIEIQVLADERGAVVHLGERECSIQRRHQKILEEAPSAVLTEKIRKRMGEAAIDLVKSARYRNAGTVEFLVDKDLKFHFIEMNTRVQVEHPVTEAITGIDVVKEQIRLSAGDSLDMKQRDVQFVGHAIECRINAEDPDTFVPSPGRVVRFDLPGGPGVRVDTAVYAGYTIPPHYDSLVAKVIVHGKTRDEAIARMSRALDESRIEGIKTNIPLQRKIMADPDFRRGKYTTHFLERYAPEP
ncbi:MAG: acetyl-CoA carboxylase biotin carboxylase subunit [Nitrospirae bacterium RBG_16_64_22]|nr:MAG: acetyl-CoA carboxylase biotin carboxylase subunit [Nitrospirae bacterium RBG_16_64_22]